MINYGFRPESRQTTVYLLCPSSLPNLHGIFIHLYYDAVCGGIITAIKSGSQLSFCLIKFSSGNKDCGFIRAKPYCKS
jgi:hypothetical protein